MNNNIPDSDMDAIEERLLGTPNSLSDFDFHHSEIDILAAIGARGNIECCSACSWWCEMSELQLIGNEFFCEDCREDEEDEQ